MSYGGFEDLEVYNKCREFRKSISEMIKLQFPKEEKYQLTAQLLNASRSVTANIAEGFGRFHYQENIQFCRIARGSLMETLEHLITAFDEGYITNEQLDRFRWQYQNCLKLLNGYISYLKKAKSNT